MYIGIQGTMTKKERINVRLDSAVKAYAGSLAKSRGMSISTLVSCLLTAEIRKAIKAEELEVE
jgi:antitoxin component of RelBE/YafQ-DinJ toxin-antitoxin module